LVLGRFVLGHATPHRFCKPPRKLKVRRRER